MEHTRAALDTDLLALHLKRAPNMPIYDVCEGLAQVPFPIAQAQRIAPAPCLGAPHEIEQTLDFCPFGSTSDRRYRKFGDE